METTTAIARRCRHCGADIAPNSSFCSRCGATAALPEPAGDALLDALRTLYHGEYEIDKEIGRGGMAAVFSGFDPGLQRRVAIKALLPDIAAEPDMAERFLREARTVAAMQHPHVVTVYGVRSNDRVQALSMQFVEGRSLDAALKEQSPMPLAVGGLVLAQVADGLQHAHDRGVVHRDVKPANVLLEGDGRAVVSDFGIAHREGMARLTDTGMVFGTWAYMSPEQRSGENVTAAADQYALGVMAYEVLAGRLPFTGTASEMLRAHLYEAPPPMRDLRPEIPAVVDLAVQRMLAKKPAQRFPSLKDVERIFRGLVPDEKATTQLIAGLSLVRQQTTRMVQAPAVRPVAPKPATPPAVVVPPTVPSAAAEAPAAAAMVRKGQTPAHGGARRLLPAMAFAALVVAGAGLWYARSRTDGTAAAPTAGANVARPDGAAASGTPASSAPTSGDAPVASTPSDAPRAASDAPGARAAIAAPNTNVRAVPLAGANATGGAGVSGAPAAPSPAAAPAPAPTAPAAEPAAPPPAAAPAATLADMRKLGSEFVTLLNKRQWRDVDQLEAFGGDAAVRAELVRLTRSAPDFAAGFDRVPSSPSPLKDGVETELVLDLQWRGGHRLMLAHLRAALKDGAWHLAGLGVEAVP